MASSSNKRKPESWRMTYAMCLKPKKKKKLSIKNSNYWGNHFVIYIYIKSACPPKTNTTVRCELYLSKTGGKEKNSISNKSLL